MIRLRCCLALVVLAWLLPTEGAQAQGKSNAAKSRHLTRPATRPIAHQTGGAVAANAADSSGPRAARGLSQANQMSGTAAGVTRGSAALHHASTRSGRDLSAQVAGGTLGKPATASGAVHSQRPNVADLQALADGTAESWQPGSGRSANHAPASETPDKLKSPSEKSRDGSGATGTRPHQAKTPNRGFWFRFR